MAKFHVTAELSGIDGATGSLEFEVAEGDLQYRYIEAVTRTDFVRDANGQEVKDENGDSVTEVVIVTPARSQTDEEALRDFIKNNLYVNFEKKGITNITATIGYTITGEVEFDAQDWGIDLEELEVDDPDEVDEYTVRTIVEDSIVESIVEDVRYNYVGVDWDVYSVEAEA